MISDTPKSFQPGKKSINYLSRDFSQLKQSLVDFAKTYYPNSYKDFSDASTGMMFIEMAAYVGDVASYYTDYQFKESMLVNAEERQNIIDCAASMGYKAKVTTPSVTQLDVYQLVPAKMDETGAIVPDMSYAQIIKPGMSVVSDNGVNFVVETPVDFTVDTAVDPLEVSVYQRNSSGQPEFYVLRKTASAFSGKFVTSEVTVGSPASFYQIDLSEPNVIEVFDVYDSDGNRWYETDYLAQDTVAIEQENIYKNDMSLSNYRDSTPFLLQYLRTSRRFVTGVKADNTTFMLFGSGTNIADDEVVIPSVYTVSKTGTFRTENIAYDPANFLSSRASGQAPANTTLTIRYLVGGGVESNVNANSIKNVGTVEFFGDITGMNAVEQNLTQLVRRSVRVNNPVPATGGRSAETNTEIRNNALAHFAAQRRAVTQQDYIVRTYGMPTKYGSIAKAYAVTDSQLDITGTGPVNQTNPFAINLYLLCYDSNQRLVVPNTAIRQNLSNYLNQYRMLTDTINLLDGYVINIGVEFSVIAYKNYNKREVLANCLTVVQQYFDISNVQFCQPINLSRLQLEIAKVDGVQSVTSLKVKNLTTRDGDYSKYEYDISAATVNNIVYPSIDPAIFEVRFPTKDIVGRVA
jgi:hypothetical protein